MIGQSMLTNILKERKEKGDRREEGEEGTG